MEPSSTLLTEIAIAALAGTLLNLTPCVLPAIPVKIRTILRESGGQTRHRVAAAAAFTAGSLVFFLAIAALTAWLQWTWGTLFQSRVFLLMLIALLLAFALITYRDLAIPIPSFAYTLHGHRFMEPALAGMFSAVLATPCAGPFLGGVLAYTLTRPAGVTFAIFAAVALGLSLPYVVILLWPQLLRRFPAGGAWALRVRQGLAFLLLAAAVFFTASLVPATVARGLWIAWAALLGTWALAALLRDTDWRARAVGILSALLGLGLASTMALSGGGAHGITWQPYEQVLSRTAIDNGRPQLIEFTADWCINCKVLERTTYSDPGVARTVDATNTVTLQADLTRPDERLSRALNEFGGAALPFAVVLNPNGVVVQRFPGMFGPDALRAALRDAANSKEISE